MDREKVISDLDQQISWIRDNDSHKYPGWGHAVLAMRDALELLKAQDEIIDDLIKVGYPHNFQREEPWIVNYMYAITDVIRKAVNLKNDAD